MSKLGKSRRNYDERLAAIIFIDMVGHSEIFKNEEDTVLQLLMVEFNKLLQNVLGKFAGMHKNYTGDGALMLFDDVPRALSFCIEFPKRWSDCAKKLKKKKVFSQVDIPPVRSSIHYGRVCSIWPGVNPSGWTLSPAN